MINRRELLGTAIGGAALAAPAFAATGKDNPFVADRLYADVLRYASVDIHQTGSTGDRATGAWILEQLQRDGFTVSSQSIEVPFFEPRQTTVQSGDLRIAGFALHPVVTTSASGLTVPLRIRYDAADDAHLAGTIAVVPLPFGRHSSALSPAIEPALTAVKRAGALAAIVITTGPSGLPIALNAPERPPFAPLPILLIGIGQAPALIARARAGERATLVIDGDAGRRRGENIVARRAGPGRKVVMTTPLSGWFRCTGERGPGVATWLAFAGWLPRAFPHLDLTFAGQVGHEFENIGSRRFLAEAAPRPEDVALWLHLGAGLATRDWHEAGAGNLKPLPSVDPQRYLLASPALVPDVRRAARGLPGLEKVYPGDAKTAAGEATGILAAGYTRVIANFAGHRFHHTENDGLEITSGDLIVPAARALRTAVATILAKA